MSTQQTVRSAWLSERARIAALTRDRKPDDPDLINARQRLHYLRLQERILNALTGQPALTRDQRIELAELLLGATR